MVFRLKIIAVATAQELTHCQQGLMITAIPMYAQVLLRFSFNLAGILNVQHDKISFMYETWKLFRLT